MDDNQTTSVPCCANEGCTASTPPQLLTEQLPAYRARAQVLKALSHPARLFMVDRLSEHEYCVCDLQKLVQLDMSTVSKHLSVLKSAGIVSDDKRGKQVWYSLRVPCIRNFFGCIEETLRHNAVEQLALTEKP